MKLIKIKMQLHLIRWLNSNSIRSIKLKMLLRLCLHLIYLLLWR